MTSSLCKTFLLSALVIAILGFIVFQPAFTQSVPKLSVPQFTVRLVDHSYDVPSTTTKTIDQYTGKEIVTTTPGYHVENKTIEVIIKNQLLSPQAFGNQSDVGLYYTVRVKGHFGTVWQEQSVSAIRPADSYVPWPLEYQTTKIQASNSEYTILTYVKGQSGWPMRNGDQIDIQVKAFVGYHKFFWNTDHIFPIYNGNAFEVSAESDWSNIQTITIPEGSVSTSTPNPISNPTISPTPIPSEFPLASPTPTPSIPEFPETVLILSMVIVLCTALLFRRRKQLYGFKLD